MRVVVLMGGSSTERNVSLATGRGVAQALVEEGFEVVAVDPSDGSRLNLADPARKEIGERPHDAGAVERARGESHLAHVEHQRRTDVVGQICDHRPGSGTEPGDCVRGGGLESKLDRERPDRLHEQGLEMPVDLERHDRGTRCRQRRRQRARTGPHFHHPVTRTDLRSAHDAIHDVGVGEEVLAERLVGTVPMALQQCP